MRDVPVVSLLGEGWTLNAFGSSGLLLPNHGQDLDTAGNRSDLSLLPRQVQVGTCHAGMRGKAENGSYHFISYQEAHSAINKPVLFVWKQRGKEIKCFQGFYLSRLKCPGKSQDKLPLKTVEALTLKFGEPLWGTNIYVKYLRFGQYYIFNCKEQNWELISL